MVKGIRGSVGFDLVWSGTKKLQDVLTKAIEQCPELVEEVLKNRSEEIKSKAREFAPVDTGMLKERIETRYPSKLTAEIASTAGYAGYQEWGTRYQTGTPHLRPAFNEITPNLEKDITDVMKGVFK